jgi:hypothetical protein
MPSNPQCTFSPTALAHYLHYTITTTHLKHTAITTSSGQQLLLPSVQSHSTAQLLDYHDFIVVCPKGCKQVTIPPDPVVNSATSEIHLS